MLVTAGGTREPIDTVRFVGNRSSGRMGFALADEAAALGAEVTVVAANVALARSPRVHYVDVTTAAELQSACEAHFAQADVLLMAAAVADYRPAVTAETKLKKDERAELVIALERTPDILSGLAAIRRADQTWSASPPSTATAPSPTRATSSRARAWTPSWSTTSRGRTSALKGQTTRSRS